MRPGFMKESRRWMYAIPAVVAAVLWGGLTVGMAQEDEDFPVIQSRPVGGGTERVEPEPPAAVPVQARGIVIGMQYALTDSRRHAAGIAALAVETGVRAVKVFPEDIRWGEMQRSAGRRIDFGALDTFVTEYQKAGYTHLMVQLQSHSPWASKDPGGNPTPRDEHLDSYAEWVRAVVERYDGDGVADMPGLRLAVRWYEIGGGIGPQVQEPMADYIPMLERASATAREASGSVVVVPAAIVTTGAFRDEAASENPEEAFAASPRRLGHSLQDVRALLDAARAYDVVNLAAYGDPYELEASLRWLKAEMESRGLAKPVIVGSTGLTPFITGGAADSCTLDPELLGVVLPPAVEDDRCRLAAYFNRLIGKDEYTRQWVQRFASADLVKKVLIAAAHDVVLINTSLIEDLPRQQDARFAAAAGNAPWAGMVDARGKRLRPAFFAVKQLNQHLHGFTEVRRMPTADEALHVYRIKRPRGNLWVAWVEPEGLLLPGDRIVAQEIDLPVQAANVVLERMITNPGQIRTKPHLLIATAGTVTITVGTQPVFVFGSY